MVPGGGFVEVEFQPTSVYEQPGEAVAGEGMTCIGGFPPEACGLGKILPDDVAEIEKLA